LIGNGLQFGIARLLASSQLRHALAQFFNG
jgi:hypothetical protein